MTQFKTLSIQSSEDDSKKTRTFSASLLGYLTADNLWEGGESDAKATRPVWIAIGGTQGAIRPFLANLRSGRKARVVGTKDDFECLRSARYTWRLLPIPGTNDVAAYGYLGDLFALDPGMVDPTKIAFVAMPHRKHLPPLTNEDAEQAMMWATSRATRNLAQDLGHCGDAVRLAHASLAFAAMLSTRCRAPFPRALDFAAGLLVRCVDFNFASSPTLEWARSRFASSMNLAELGCADVVSVRASHQAMRDLLSEEVRAYQASGRMRPVVTGTVAMDGA